MKGSFSEGALQKYAELAAQSQSLEFSESGTYDFTRCVRPDGSAYGTSGKCRAGTEEAKTAAPQKEKKAAKPPKPGKPVPAAVNKDITKLQEKIVAKTGVKRAETEEKPQKPNEGNLIDKLKKKVKETVQKAKDLAKGKKADPVSETPSEEYARLLKKKMDLAAKGDIKAALKVSPELKAALAKVKAEQAKTASPEESTYTTDRKADQVRDARQAEANLTSRQKKAISDYTSAGGDPSNPRRSFLDVNGCLRSPPTCVNRKASDTFAKEVDEAIAKLPKNDEGHQFYRGVDARSGTAAELYKQLQTVQPGMRMRDPGFGSYSSDKGVTEDFMGRNQPSILFVSRNRNLTPINMFSQMPEEREALMPRGTEQTVRKVTKNGNTLIVEID